MALTLAEAHRMMQAAIAKAEELHVKEAWPYATRNMPGRELAS